MSYNKFNTYLFFKTNDFEINMNKSLIEMAIPRLAYTAEIKFNPGNYNLITEPKKSSFLKKYIQILYFFNLFIASFSDTPRLYFHKFSDANIKFRKRDNIFCTFLLKSRLRKSFSFFFKLPLYLTFLCEVSKQIYHVYKIKSGIIGMKRTNKTLILYILNPHYIYSYLNNSKIDKVKFVVKLHVPSVNKKLIRQLFYFLN